MAERECGGFGQQIRTLRAARDLDQATLAERVEARLGQGHGFDVTYLSKIERGRVGPPSERVVLALADELEADCYDLLALAGRVPPGVGELLMASPGARAFWRAAADLGLTEDDWEHLAGEARRLVGTRRTE